MLNFLLVWTISCFFTLTSESLVLLQSSNNSLGLTFRAPPLRFNATPTTYEITAQVVDGSDPYVNVNGRIVVFYENLPGERDWAEQVLVWVQQGAVAVLLGPPPFFKDHPGYLQYLSWPTGDGIPIAINELRQSDIETVLEFATNSTLIAKLDSYDPNPWQEVCEGVWMLLFQIILSSAVATVLILAIYDWILFIKRNNGIRMNVPQISLIIIILGMIWRLIYVAVNPFTCRRGTWPSKIDDMFFTSHIPASLAPVFLVSLYHYEITSKTALQVNNFLKKMKIPFYVATGAVFAFEIVMSALRGNGYAVDVVIYLNIGVYFLISIIFTFFFFYTSFRIFFKLKSSKAISSVGKINRLKNITIWITISGIGLLYMDLMIFPMLSENFSDPMSFTATFFNFWLALTIISFAHVLVYMIHKKRSQEPSSISQKRNLSLQTFPMSPRDPKIPNTLEGDQKENVSLRSDNQQIPSPESSEQMQKNDKIPHVV